MTQSIFLHELRSKKYGRVICYPNYSEMRIERLIHDIEILGVIRITFKGNKLIKGIPVLGKGSAGIVVLAKTDFLKAALKIRRTDSDINTIIHEAKMLRLANTVEIGPKLLEFNQNILMMKFIEGTLYPEWIKGLQDTKTSRMRVKKLLSNIMHQCRRLDKLGLDHGELNWAPRHIIIDKNDVPYIIDFETASINRRVSNVTSICNYLFMRKNNYLSSKEDFKTERGILVHFLSNYKKNQTETNYREILNMLDLRL